MKLLVFIILLTTLSAQAAINYKATYRSFDGQTTYKCDVKVENDLAKNYGIFCFDKNGILKKSYSAHLMLNKYHMKMKPFNKYELLYWITDKATRESASTTIWFNISDQSQMHSANVSLGVDNDLAGLYLDVLIQ
jgi:hypothetical protein